MANTKITTNVIADDAITTAKIADDAVGNDQLASGLTLGGNTAATLSTAAQPNITSVGTLTALTVGGTLNVTGGTSASFTGHIDLVDSKYLRLGNDADFIIYHDGSSNYVQAAKQDSDIIFRGNDGGSGVNMLTLDTSAAGAATFNVGATFGGDVGIGVTPSAGKLHVRGSGTSSSTNAIFADNSSSAGLFAIRDNGDAFILGKTGIGISSPTQKLDVRGGSGAGTLTHAIFTGTASRGLEIRTRSDTSGGQNSGTAEINSADSEGTGGDLAFSSNGNVRMFIDGGGNVGINDTSPFAKLHVEDTSWSSGSPYGAVAYIQGGDVNDLNWGHLLVSQSGTTADTGGRISLGANGENPIAGIRAKYKGATYGDLALLTRPSGGTSAERLVIDSSGRVIIGGSATIQDGYSTAGANSGENNYYGKLWIQGNTYSTSGDGRLTLASGTAWPSTGTQIGSIWFSTSWGGDHASIRAVTNGGTGNNDYPASIHFDTTADGASSPTERFVVRMDGGLQIPASSSNSGANINGWLSHHTNNYFYMRGGTEGLFLMSGNAEASQGRIFVPGGGNPMTFVINNTTRLSIAANGDFTGSASNDISDQRIKENIQTIPNALTTIKALQGRTFTWKEEAGQSPGVKYGFVAQEVESVVSDLVHDESGIIKINSDGSLNKNPSDEDEGEYAKSVQSTGVIPILVEAIKELSAEVESLKEKLNG